MAPIMPFLRGAAILALAFVSGVTAQTSTASGLVPAATQDWRSGFASCRDGLANPSGNNGYFTDSKGAYWQVNCGLRQSRAPDYSANTTGQGIYACFKSCDRRALCTGFYFVGSVSGATTGDGTCYYNLGKPTTPYITSTETFTGNGGTVYGLYAGAHLISNGSPNVPCPYYDQATFTDSAGNVWRVSCGYDSDSQYLGFTEAADMVGCMAACNAYSGCTSFSYTTNTGPEVLDGGTAGSNCYFKTGSAPLTGGGGVQTNFALRIGQASTIGTPPQTSPASTSLPRPVTSAVVSTTGTPTTRTSTATSIPYQTASQTWSGPVAVCSSGLPNPADQNGTYVDTQGAAYQVNCGQQNTAITYYASGQGTNTQGIYACFKSCNRRPGCIGFYLIGSVTGPTSGTGRCYYQNGLAAYTINANVYAGANLIANGSPRNPCPYYGGRTFTDASGVAWRMQCGVDTSNPATGSTTVSNTTTLTMTDCMALCTGDCLSFMFTLTDADGRGEPLDSGATASVLLGICYLRTSLFTTPTNTGLYGYAARVVSPPPSSTLLSTTSSSTSTLLALTSTQITATSSSVVVTSSAVVVTSAAVVVTSSTVVATSSIDSSSSPAGPTGSYTPPPPNYSVPIPAGSVNASSGCGRTLPAGLVADGSSVQYTVRTADGNNRVYKLHIPKLYDPLRASPLIFTFPGAQDADLNVEGASRFNDGTLNPYGVVVYVQGVNYGFQSNPNNNAIDDIGFVRSLVANMTANFCIDTGRIWSAGFSNGGGFTNVLACDPVMSSVFSVFAATSGAFYTAVRGPGDPLTVSPVDTPVGPCSPSRNNIPFVEVHGTGDTTINYAGEANRNGVVLPSVPRWTTAWAIRQGYSAVNVTTPLAPGLTRYQFGNSNNLGIITQYTLAGWSHLWADTARGAQLSSSPVFMAFFYDQTNSQRAVAAVSSSISSSTSSVTSTGGSSTVSSVVPPTTSSIGSTTSPAPTTSSGSTTALLSTATGSVLTTSSIVSTALSSSTLISSSSSSSIGTSSSGVVSSGVGSSTVSSTTFSSAIVATVSGVISSTSSSIVSTSSSLAALMTTSTSSTSTVSIALSTSSSAVVASSRGVISSTSSSSIGTSSSLAALTTVSTATTISSVSTGLGTPTVSVASSTSSSVIVTSTREVTSSTSSSSVGTSSSLAASTTASTATPLSSVSTGFETSTVSMALSLSSSTITASSLAATTTSISSGVGTSTIPVAQSTSSSTIAASTSGVISSTTSSNIGTSSSLAASTTTGISTGVSVVPPTLSSTFVTSSRALASSTTSTSSGTPTSSAAPSTSSGNIAISFSPTASNTFGASSTVSSAASTTDDSVSGPSAISSSLVFFSSTSSTIVSSFAGLTSSQESSSVSAASSSRATLTFSTSVSSLSCSLCSTTSSGLFSSTGSSTISTTSSSIISSSPPASFSPSPSSSPSSTGLSSLSGVSSTAVMESSIPSALSSSAIPSSSQQSFTRASSIATSTTPAMSFATTSTPASSFLASSSLLPSSLVRSSSSVLASPPAPTSSAGEITSSTSPSDVTTTSEMPRPSVYYPPPPACERDAAALCAPAEDTSTCSSESGQAYNVTCGVAYVGVVFDDNDISPPPPYDTQPFIPPNRTTTSSPIPTPTPQPVKRDLGADFMLFERKLPLAVRIPLPDIATCQSTCERSNTTEHPCVATNFDTTTYECTLFSEVTGTVQQPGVVAAEPVANPPVAIDYSTYYSSTTSTVFSLGTTTAGVSTTSSAAPVSTNPVSSASCPGSDGQTVIDSCGVQYLIGCGDDTFPGGSSQVRTDSFNECFEACSSGRNGACTGFTFQFIDFGVCYLKNGGNMYFQDPAPNKVGAININCYLDAAGPNAPAPAETSRVCATAASSTLLPAYTSPSVSLPGTTSDSSSSSESIPSESLSITSMLPMSSVGSSADSSTSSATIDGPPVYSEPSTSEVGNSNTALPTGYSSDSAPSYGFPSITLLPSAPATTTAPTYENGTSASGSPTTQSISTTITACPTETAEICADTIKQTICTDGEETTYAVQCGLIYLGNEIPEERVNTTGLMKRFETDTFGDCQQACTDTDGCIALNYIDSDCTLLDSVEGTLLVPGAVSAVQVPGDGIPPTYSQVSSQISSSTSVIDLPPTYTGNFSMSSALSLTTIAIPSNFPPPPYSGGDSITLSSSSSSADLSSTPRAPSYPGDGTATPSTLTFSTSIGASSTPGAPSYPGENSSAAGGVTASTTPSGAPPMYSNSESTSLTSLSLSIPVSISGPPIYSGPSISVTSISSPDTFTATIASESSPPGVSSNVAPTYGGESPTGAPTNGVSVTTSNGIPSPSGSFPTLPPGYSSAPTGPQNGNLSSSSSRSVILPPGYSSGTGGVITTPVSSGPSGPITPGASSTTTAIPTAAVTLCPTYNGQNYTNSEGVTYTVDCNTALTGTTYTIDAPPTYNGIMRRQANTAYTAETCMAVCNTDDQCVGINITPSGCVYFSSITGSTGALGTTALVKVAAAPTAGTTVTVSVCRASTTRTVTVFTTVSIATCSAGTVCPAAASGARLMVRDL